MRARLALRNFMVISCRNPSVGPDRKFYQFPACRSRRASAGAQGRCSHIQLQLELAWSAQLVSSNVEQAVGVPPQGAYVQPASVHWEKLGCVLHAVRALPSGAQTLFWIEQPMVELHLPWSRI